MGEVRLLQGLCSWFVQLTTRVGGTNTTSPTTGLCCPPDWLLGRPSVCPSTFRPPV